MDETSRKGKVTIDELMPLVYEELRRLASRYLLGERPGHTLRPTALVHETYLKLAGGRAEWHDRLKFLAAAATAMRRILVDHARAQSRLKRGCRPKKVVLDDSVVVSAESSLDLLDLNAAIEKLARLDMRKGQIIELLFFGGLTYDECAAILDISPVTLHRELKAAKAWLYYELEPADRQA